jgi:predicted ATP-dependent endonuclease of OLD family
LNILIGKNNSGKSNVLAGIEVGLAHLKSGHVTSSRTTRGRIADEFTHRNTDVPLQIGIEFEVTPEFTQLLCSQLQNETVGLEVAIEQLREISTISVVIAGALHANKAYRYLQEIDYGPIRADLFKLKTERACLFRLPDDVATVACTRFG